MIFVFAIFVPCEQRGLKVWLVDARQMKYVPGLKSDVQDCQWLQKLMSLGFLRAAFRPDGDVCQLRAVARQRETLLTEQASWVQRQAKGAGTDEHPTHGGTERCHGLERLVDDS